MKIKLSVQDDTGNEVRVVAECGDSLDDFNRMELTAQLWLEIRAIAPGWFA